MKKLFIVLTLLAFPAHAQLVTSGVLTTAQDRATTVAAGSYTCTNATFDAYGRATSAANGSCSGGGGSGAASVKTSSYTITTGDCGSTVMMGTGSTGQLTVTLPSAAGFSAGCTVYVKNGDTARGKIKSGFPSGFSILWPLQTVGVQVINSAWQVIEEPGMWKVPSQQVIHVDKTNGNNANDGLAAGAGGAVQDAQTAANRAVYQFDNNATSTIIAMACGQTHTSPLGLGGTNTGTNLLQLSPDGNCGFTWNTTGPAILVGDLAELDIRLDQYGSSGSMTCNANTANATNSGCIYLHNDAVVDLEGTAKWTPGGSNDNFLYCDGGCTFAIANGITLLGGGAGNYFINMDAGGKGTLSGSLNATASGSVTGVVFLTGRSMINYGASNGGGWSSVGSSKVYGNSVFVGSLGGLGSLSLGTTGVNCTSMTASC